MVGIPGPSLDPATRDRLTDLRPAGVILFGRNLTTPQSLVELIAELGRLPAPPVLLAIDQEGGRVSRLEPWIGVTPTARELARRGSAEAQRFGRLTGEALSALGFNVDFAPVLDLSETDAPNGIGDRSFGTDPRAVIELAGAFLDGLQAAGVAGCLKHFPGLGCTRVDSHVELPRVDRGADELERLDLAPYLALAPRAASVMIGHGHYPAWDPGSPLPASGSAAIVRGLLRERLGYRGLVVSDDLLMGAVARHDEDGAFAVQALAAGCDLLLYCADLARAELASTALERAAEADPEFGERLERASEAVERLSRRWPAPRPRAADWARAQAALRAFA